MVYVYVCVFASVVETAIKLVDCLRSVCLQHMFCCFVVIGFCSTIVHL